ncbi:MAG TPA: chromate resistance protein ChrB domain-containing protein, partial [Candidatus Dormibacteraeota bacterium]|nr:chromate resistance protein ChrB domain-containing protein [Candidatus Dormibacteraeota bacterium]
MKWVTRKNANVDRIACPWLIRRFIDKDAEFLFVPADEVAAVAQRESA